MMSLFGVVIAGAAAYWVFNDAKGRGHENGTAIMWSIGTFALLIIFLPLYLVFGRKRMVTRREEPVVDIEAVPVDQIMFCPMCGKKVQNDFVTCPYCSHTLNPKCVKCGRDLNREWRTCPYCEAQATSK
jgi:RNA polymerase subunit RPABC4/transcription elongation factor Spt4